MKTPFNYLALSAPRALHTGTMTAMVAGQGDWTPEDLLLIGEEVKIITSATGYMVDRAVNHATQVEGFDHTLYKEEPELMMPTAEHRNLIVGNFLFNYACIAYTKGSTTKHILNTLMVGLGMDNPETVSKKWLAEHSHALNVEGFLLLDQCARFLPNDRIVEEAKQIANVYIQSDRTFLANIFINLILDFYVAELYKANIAHRIINEGGVYEIVEMKQKG